MWSWVSAHCLRPGPLSCALQVELALTHPLPPLRRPPSTAPSLPAKATDENQTAEDWSIFLTVWEKVNEDGEAG